MYGRAVTPTFTWTGLPARGVFAACALDRVPEEVDRLETRRVLLVTGTASTREALNRVRAALDDRCVGVVRTGVQHGQSGLAEDGIQVVRDASVDVVVTLGGGSVIGLGKAIVQACELPLLAVPTTYSGSEMTPIWGRTSEGRKQTWFDIRVLPRTVVYDPELCLGMPPRLAAASGMNALAHCLEALWSAGANPITSLLAVDGGRRLIDGLPRVTDNPDNPDNLAAHAGILIGACLAGRALAQAGTAIHHRTAHVLGGGWNLPHAETHAAVLPHSTALVTSRSPAAMKEVRRLFDSDNPAGAVFALLHSLRLPISLAAIGMPEDGLDEAARRVVEACRNDPIAPDQPTVRRMLDDAFFGREPAQ